jgi:hypothetical protein
LAIFFCNPEVCARWFFLDERQVSRLSFAPGLSVHNGQLVLIPFKANWLSKESMVQTTNPDLSVAEIVMVLLLKGDMRQKEIPAKVGLTEQGV